MEGAYLNNISFKDLILKYLIEEISKKKECNQNDLHFSNFDVSMDTS